MTNDSDRKASIANLGEKVLVIAPYVVIITGSVASFSLFIGYFVLGLPFP